MDLRTCRLGFQRHRWGSRACCRPAMSAQLSLDHSSMCVQSCAYARIMARHIQFRTHTYVRLCTRNYARTQDSEQLHARTRTSARTHEPAIGCHISTGQVRPQQRCRRCRRRYSCCAANNMHRHACVHTCMPANACVRSGTEPRRRASPCGAVWCSVVQCLACIILTYVPTCPHTYRPTRMDGWKDRGRTNGRTGRRARMVLRSICTRVRTNTCTHTLRHLYKI